MRVKSHFQRNVTTRGGLIVKENKDSVRAYHQKLSAIKLRFPSEDVCGVDYAQKIRDRAKELGFIIKKGKDKGEGSANAYILHLIESDLQIDGMMKKISDVK